MKKQKQKQLVNIDEFDSTVSLWQLLPSGAGRGLSHLKLIVDSVLNNKADKATKPFSLLVTGKQGTRTHARGFIRALGLEYINEMPAHLLQAPTDAIYDFFKPELFGDSYLISNIDTLYPAVLKTPYQIISKGKYIVIDYSRNIKEIYAVYRPLVMTTHNINKLPKYFLEKIDHIVKLEDYTDQQLELAVLQRLKYANIDYQEEKVLSLLVAYGHSKLYNIIRLLKSSITVMLSGSDSRKTLTVDDIKKVVAYS